MSAKTKRVALISCVSMKCDTSAGAVAAEELYISPLFKKALAYAKQVLKPDAIYILSAKHELLPLRKKVESYNETLNNANAAKRKQWSANVIKQLKAEGLDLSHDTFYLLAGKKYYQYLLGDGGIANAVLPYQDCGGIGYILSMLDNELSKIK